MCAKIDADHIYENVPAQDDIDKFVCDIYTDEMDDTGRDWMFKKVVFKTCSENIDVKDRFLLSKDRTSRYIKMKILADLLRRDDLSTKERNLARDQLCTMIDKTIDRCLYVKQKFNFKYYENCKQYKKAEDIYNKCFK